jgi:hypothetical protein
MSIKYTKWLENRTNAHKICQDLPFPDLKKLPKFFINIPSGNPDFDLGNVGKQKRFF